MKRRLLIVAGDPSGDRHGADLVRQLKARLPDWQMMGVGGPYLQSAGVELIAHLDQVAVLGFTEVLAHLPYFRRLLRHIQRLMDEGLDGVILVDFPGFNFRVARMAHAKELPVIYYICPQLWAWGTHRVAKMRRLVDLPLVIFPFEESFYRRRGVPARFVGHPLVDQLSGFQPEADFFHRHRLSPKRPILGLFPGSRRQEVLRHLPVMAAVAGKLQATHGVVPIVGALSHIPEDVYRQALSGWRTVTVVRDETHRLMAASYLALVASGTATLELGFFQVPMVVGYRLTWTSYWLARALVRIPMVALVNIVLGKRVVPELIQHQFTTSRLYEATRELLENPWRYRETKNALSRVREVLGLPGAAQRASLLIYDLLSSTST